MTFDSIEYAEATGDFEHARVLRFLEKINDPIKWLYGSELRDKMLLGTPSMLPRFAHLARKAYMHYAKERYNPHTISLTDEFIMRDIIKGIIEYKIEGKVKGYDWEAIDQLLIKLVNDQLGLNLPYDQKRLDQGLLPEFKSPFHDLETDIVN